MTVAALPSVAIYKENGVSLPFAAPFRFKAASDLVVERLPAAGGVVPLVLGVDYTVTGGSTDAGGTVTLAASVTGARLRISRRTSRAQSLSYPDGGRFPAASHEAAIDQLTLVNQEQDDSLAEMRGRALLAPVGEAAPTLPGKAQRAGTFLAFDANGDGTPASGTGADAGLRTDLASDNGSALLRYRSPGVGAVARSLADKLSDTLCINDFGAVGDGIADDTVAVQRFLAALKATGKRGILPSKTFLFTAPLSIAMNDLDLQGEGRAALLYGGASTTSDILTIGDGLTVYDRVNLNGFRLLARDVMTGGWGLRLKSSRAVDIDVKVGDEYGPLTIRDGIWLDSVTDCVMHRSGIYSRNNGLRHQNGFEVKLDHMVIKGDPANRQGIAVHVGGGVGGFYTEHLQEQFHAVSMRIANDIVATGNQQIFIGQTTTLDVSGELLVIEDGTNNPIGKFIEVACWLGSAQTGPAVRIKNWATGKIVFNGAKITSGLSSGIYNEDALAIIEILADTTIYNNAGYGIDASVPTVLRCLVNPNNLNLLGGVSGNITVINDLPGSQRFLQDPTKQWALDFSRNFVTIANGASAVLAVGSGKLIIANDTTGEIGEYNVGGGAVQMISGGLGGFVAPSTTPAAGKVSVQSDGANYRIYNNAGGTRTFRVGALLVRASN